MSLKTPTHIRLLALLVPGAILAVLPWFTHMAVPKLAWAAGVLAAAAVAWWRFERAASGAAPKHSPQSNDVDAHDTLAPDADSTPRQVADSTPAQPWDVASPRWGFLLLGAYVLTSVPAWLTWDNHWLTLRMVALESVSLLFLALLVAVGRQRELLAWFVRYLEWGLAFLAGIWFLEWTGVATGFSAVPGGATLGNTGLVGEMAGVGFVLVAHGTWRAWHQSAPVATRLTVVLLRLALLAALAFAVTMTQSMTGTMAIVLALSAVGFYRVWQHHKWIAAVSLAALVVGVVLAFLFVPAMDLELQRRLYVWRMALDIWSQSPWWGHGAGSFARQFLDAQGNFLSTNPSLAGWWSQADYAHNIWLQLGCERGLPVVLSTAALFVWVAVRFMRQHRPLELAVWIAMVAVCTGSIGFESVAMRLFMTLNLALALWPDRGWRPRLGFTAPRFTLGLAVGVLLGVLPAAYTAAIDVLAGQGKYEAVLTLAPFHATAHVQKAQQLAEAGELQEALVEINQAERYEPSLVVLMESGRLFYAIGNIEKAEARWQQVARWHRRYMPAWANLAVLYAESGRIELARRHLARARSLLPSDPRVRTIETYIRNLEKKVAP